MHTDKIPGVHPLTEWHVSRQGGLTGTKHTFSHMEKWSWLCFRYWCKQALLQQLAKVVVSKGGRKGLRETEHVSPPTHPPPSSALSALLWDRWDGAEGSGENGKGTTKNAYCLATTLFLCVKPHNMIFFGAVVVLSYWVLLSHKVVTWELVKCPHYDSFSSWVAGWVVTLDFTWVNPHRTHPNTAEFSKHLNSKLLMSYSNYEHIVPSAKKDGQSIQACACFCLTLRQAHCCHGKHLCGQQIYKKETRLGNTSVSACMLKCIEEYSGVCTDLHAKQLQLLPLGRWIIKALFNAWYSFLLCPVFLVAPLIYSSRISLPHFKMWPWKSIDFFLFRFSFPLRCKSWFIWATRGRSYEAVEHQKSSYIYQTD